MCVGMAGPLLSLLWSVADLKQIVGVGEGPLELPLPTRQTLYLVDDAHRIEMDDLGLGTHLAGAVPVVMFAVGTADFLSMRTSFLRTLPRLRSGLVLAPGSIGDARAFGINRLGDVAVAEPRAGRGLLVTGGEAPERRVPQCGGA